MMLLARAIKRKSNAPSQARLAKGVKCTREANGHFCTVATAQLACWPLTNNNNNSARSRLILASWTSFCARKLPSSRLASIAQWASVVASCCASLSLELSASGSELRASRGSHSVRIIVT